MHDMAHICFIAKLWTDSRLRNGIGLGQISAEKQFNFLFFFVVDSETLPHGFDMILPDAYNEVKNDSFRGNFLAVVGRNESDKTLLSLMEKYFEKGNYIIATYNNGRTLGNW